MSVDQIAQKGRLAGKSPWIERLGRAGLVAKALLYLVIGALAVQVVVGARGEDPDKGGALRTIAAQPFGRLLLVALALGFAGYASWRLAQAVLDRDDEGAGAKALAKRAAKLGQAGLYASVCILTVGVIRGGRGGDGPGEQQTTADVLGLPFGRYLVFGAAAGFVAAALWNGYRAVTFKFRRKLRTERMGEAEKAAATGVGFLGHLARLVVFGLVGSFLAKAAWEFDPREAVGLDGALQKLAAQPHGGILLGAVAAGLVAYGLYCLVEARYREV